MSYSKRVVKRRPASLTDAEWLLISERGKLPRPDFRPRDGRESGRVVVEQVLCCFCRTFHHPSEVEECMVLPRKSVDANGSPSSTLKPLGAGLFAEFSEIWAFLTARTHPDGAPRLTGSLSLSCDQDLVKASLTDEETGQYACLTAHDLSDLLTEIELRLSDGSLAWRKSRYAGKKK